MHNPDIIFRKRSTRGIAPAGSIIGKKRQVQTDSCIKINLCKDLVRSLLYCSHISFAGVLPQLMQLWHICKNDNRKNG